MQKITAQDFLALKKQNPSLTLIDVRNPDEHAHKHFPGSVLMPLNELAAHKDQLPKQGNLYLLCQSGNRSSQACEKLNTMGFANAISIDGGILALEKAGAALESFGGVIPIMRQVQIVAGGLVFVGAVLAKILNPNFIYLSGFVGAGLLFAGVSGTCAMANLLSLMPWNKTKTNTKDKSCCS